MSFAAMRASVKISRERTAYIDLYVGNSQACFDKDTYAAMDDDALLALFAMDLRKCLHILAGIEGKDAAYWYQDDDYLDFSPTDSRQYQITSADRDGVVRDIVETSDVFDEIEIFKSYHWVSMRIASGAERICVDMDANVCAMMDDASLKAIFVSDVLHMMEIYNGDIEDIECDWNCDNLGGDMYDVCFTPAGCTRTYTMTGYM
jgi:hypothetical protein